MLFLVCGGFFLFVFCERGLRFTSQALLNGTDDGSILYCKHCLQLESWQGEKGGGNEMQKQ